MPLYLGRHLVGYCQRSGFKVKRSDLVRDGETGLLVERGWEDQEHPQKFLVPTEDRTVPRRPGVLTNIEPIDELNLDPIVDD